MHQRHNLIAKEGWNPIFSFILLVFLLHHYFGAITAAPTGTVVILLLFLFRDPLRKIPASPLGIVAPMDSTVVAITPVVDPYLDTETLRIQLKGHAWGVFAVRSPMEGKVNKQWFDVTGNDVETGESIPTVAGHFAQWTQSDEGDNVIMALRPRFYKRPLQCVVQGGERIGQGQRCGFIPFGANIDVYVPANCRMDVAVGDVVVGGSSIIATLVRTH